MAVDGAVGIVIIEFVRIHFFSYSQCSQWLQLLITISNNTQRTMADDVAKDSCMFTQNDKYYEWKEEKNKDKERDVYICPLRIFSVQRSKDFANSNEKVFLWDWIITNDLQVNSTWHCISLSPELKVFVNRIAIFNSISKWQNIQQRMRNEQMFELNRMDSCQTGF